VSEGTLRMWEARHNFPVPTRLPSGHRRYSLLDLRRVTAVTQDRERGLSLTTAIERARRLTDEPRPSVYSALRENFSYLQPHVLPTRALLTLSRAIEDESCARAERPLLFGCFQHERFYRQAEHRWRELARTAERAIVLADFGRRRRRKGAPLELSLEESDPLIREWVVVCEGQTFAACVVGFERPGTGRWFETVWSGERAVVREAARTCAELAARTRPELGAELSERLSAPLPPTQDELRSLIDLTTRMVRYATDQAAARAAP
jgi:DICT domain-containing protein